MDLTVFAEPFRCDHARSRTGTVSQKTGVCAFGQRTGIRFLRLIPDPRLPEPLVVREIAVKP